LAVLGVAFVLDLTGGLANSFLVVVNRLISDVATWLTSLF